MTLIENRWSDYDAVLFLIMVVLGAVGKGVILPNRRLSVWIFTE